ncbi:odorant receptor 13a-like [Danaus plexippus]|uniref:odorant receptor 13a-like n=1 Tax=Danaus plexippus TaxID=13037 RepID=UPI002AB098FC|nr:odorant receptor 13a-like [Danaus plexippus]
MVWFKALKSFFFKKKFDFKSPSINLYDFHPQIRIFLMLNGIFFNNTDSKLRFFWPIITLGWSIVGISFELMFIYHGVTVADYSFATECFCYFLILGTVPLVLMSILFNRTKILIILELMNKDFLYVSSLGLKYRDIFLNGQLLIWQLCVLWFCFASYLIMMYFLSPISVLIYQSLFATQDENTVRPLLFPFWLPKDDPYKSPNYEIFLLMEVLIACLLIQTFCVLVYMIFHVLLHCFYMLSIIILDCEALFGGLDESVVKLDRYNVRRLEVQHILNNRVKRIVNWHVLIFQYIQSVSSVFGPVLVYQVSLSSVAICLAAYQVAHNLDEGKFNIIFVTLLTATCLQLWIPCYLGTLIRNKAFTVADAIWESGWNETPLSLLIRTDMMIIILRSHNPITIKFTALPNLELETFSSIMGTSYSYFNILRQYK